MKRLGLILSVLAGILLAVSACGDKWEKQRNDIFEFYMIGKQYFPDVYSWSIFGATYCAAAMNFEDNDSTAIWCTLGAGNPFSREYEKNADVRVVVVFIPNSQVKPGKTVEVEPSSVMMFYDSNDYFVADDGSYSKESFRYNLAEIYGCKVTFSRCDSLLLSGTFTINGRLADNMTVPVAFETRDGKFALGYGGRGQHRFVNRCLEFVPGQPVSEGWWAGTEEIEDILAKRDDEEDS